MPSVKLNCVLLHIIAVMYICLDVVCIQPQYRHVSTQCAFIKVDIIGIYIYERITRKTPIQTRYEGAFEPLLG